MALHLMRELDKLKRLIVELSALVEENQQQALRALERRDAALARHVMEKDAAVDQAEVEVEEECLKILALYQPVAVDLRFIVAVLKINSDLERIGDLAVNMAERAVALAELPPPDVPLDFGGMADKASRMVRNALDSLVNLDLDLARTVREADDEVDEMNREMYVRIRAALAKHPDHAESLLHLLSSSRHLERIADHATNIAEDVMYMIEGDIVRHHAE